MHLGKFLLSLTSLNIYLLRSSDVKLFFLPDLECIYCPTRGIPGNHATFEFCHGSLNSGKHKCLGLRFQSPGIKQYDRIYWFHRIWQNSLNFPQGVYIHSVLPLNGRREPNRVFSFSPTDIDACLGVSCRNNGTCVDMVDDYICNCVQGFTGKHCQTGKTF